MVERFEADRHEETEAHAGRVQHALGHHEANREEKVRRRHERKDHQRQALPRTNTVIWHFKCMGMQKTFACNVSKLITYYVANYRDLNKCISNALNRTCKLSTAVCSCISPLLQCTRTNQHHCSVLMHTNNTAVYSYIPAARRGNGGCEHPAPQLRA